MTKEDEDKLLNEIITALDTYALGDIVNSREIHKPPVSINIILATFILCSCFIDQMAQIRYYNEKGLGYRFRKFVKEYFGSRYNPKKLYDSLRCRLVHNYSVNGMYWLTDDNSYRHLESVNGRIYLNIDDFISDIKNVWLKFKNDLLNDPNTRRNAMKHQKDYPILKQGRI